MRGGIDIVAVGARTPLGLQAAPAAAAVRAGIMATGDHPYMVDQVGDPMPAAMDLELDPRMAGPKRLLALAETALREACLPLAITRLPRVRLPIYLGLPEIRPGFAEQDAVAVQSGLGRLQGLPADLLDPKVFTDGHAAGISALAAAVELLRQGEHEMCLVGGVESYFHPDTMEWLDANRQLAGAVSRSGFVPGEGAGFCLLVTGHAAERSGLTALAKLRAVSVGLETKLIKTSDMCLGEGLTATVREALGDLRSPRERISGIICDANGERYRSEEWGFVCLRMGEYFDDIAGYLSPAERWGDMGAASGPLFAMLACEAIARGYSRGPLTLLWASSERGRRGVAVIEAGGTRIDKVN